MLVYIKGLFAWWWRQLPRIPCREAAILCILWDFWNTVIYLDISPGLFMLTQIMHQSRCCPRGEGGGTLRILTDGKIKCQKFYPQASNWRVVSIICGLPRRGSGIFWQWFLYRRSSEFPWVGQMQVVKISTPRHRPDVRILWVAPPPP